MDICVRKAGSNNEWSSSVSHVTPAIREAYSDYKERHNYYRETPFITSEYIVYRPDNDPYLPTYIARIDDIPNVNDNMNITQQIHDTMENDGKTMPIIDLNDISVFIVDNPLMPRANWLPARSYQIWAYRDFIYDRNRTIKKSYMSRGTNPAAYDNNDRILQNQIVTIGVANISPNIVFNISRNENNSVYYERNDELRTRVRICDNEYARTGYLGFYTRLTMDPGIVVIPSPPGVGPTVYYNHLYGEAHVGLLSISHLPEPEETDNEEHQCILCFKYRINARFSPCEHKVCCAGCYSKMAKNECPVCRAAITQVTNV